MRLKDADKMVESIDQDQTAPSGVVWSGPTAFVQTSLLGSIIMYFCC